ncbi:MAG: metallophosphoesterase family protein [Verrucomicrobia bacterium]|nr:metallophosphoesterase family protein [Verrucomicrobiota bacterium]
MLARAAANPVVGVTLHILSDLHLEFGPANPEPAGGDVVVLAGDIAPGLAGLEMAAWLFPGRPVVYVAGNHEYYGQALPQLTEELKRAAEGTRVRFLENREAVLQGVRFLGCTLWTDFGLFGKARAEALQRIAGIRMNDYRVVRDSRSGAWLRPDATRALHMESRAWLERALAAPFDGPTVVVTHHAPSIRSIDLPSRGDPIWAAYASDLEALMGRERVVLWVHGHTHCPADYEVRGTRVLSNPRGYPHQCPTGFNPGLAVQV